SRVAATARRPAVWARTWIWAWPRTDACAGRHPLRGPRHRLPLRFLRRGGEPHARSRSSRQPQHAVLDFEALERIVEQPVELGQLAGILDTRERAGEVERLRGQEPRPDRGA